VAAATPQNKNETKNESTETRTAIGHTDTQTQKFGYTPREVRATVTIPRSHIVNVWKSRNPSIAEPPKPEDLTPIETQVVGDIQDIVEPLLRTAATKGQDNYKYSSVVVLDSLPGPVIEPPSMAASAMAWAGRSWNTLAMLGVAIVSLLVLRGVVKSAPPGDGTAGTGAGPKLTLHADESAAAASGNADESAEDRPRLRLKKGKSLKDDLVEIVREDPDAAADILRSWIGKAG
jgi:flagellar M-ring protein FliF